MKTQTESPLMDEQAIQRALTRMAHEILEHNKDTSKLATVSQTLIALESKGLIRRIRCDEDRRKVRLGLTEAGDTMLGLDPLREIERASAGVPVSDRNCLVAAITTIVNDLCTHHEGPLFGVCGTCCHLDSSEESDGCEGTRRCGLTKDPLAAGELTQICVDFAPCK